jgi:tetratricopeptide (TPR) repeat protein
MQTHKQCEEIALGPLAQDHIRRYLDLHFAPNDFPVDLPALIERKTEGHPLFATSLIQFLAERGDIGRVNAHWSLTRQLSAMDLEAPENVLSMIRKKIDALADEDRRVLQYASACGDEFLSVIVARLLEMDELTLEEHLARLARTHRLIQEDGEEELPDGTLASRYRFVHALYQNLLYAGLVSKRRVMLHRQTGEQLAAHYGKQSARISAQLAMHFERGRDFPRAIEYLGKAGDNAGALYAYAEAEEHYTRALDLLGKGTAESEADVRFQLCMKRGSARQAMGRFEDAIKDFELALISARELGDASRESNALNAMSTALFYWHRVEEMEARCGEALAAADRAGNVAAQLESMVLMAMSRICYGQLDDARPMLDDVIATASSTGNHRALANGLAWRGILHFFQSEYETAETIYQRAIGLASDLRDGFLLLFCYFGMGLVRGNLGRISHAVETLQTGIEIARRNRDGFWYPRLPNCIGWIHREIQDFDGALKYDRQGADLGHSHKVLEAEANSLINIGIDHLQSGDHESRLGTFRQVEDIFARDAWFRWRYNIRLQAALCEHYLVKADTGQAREYAHKLLHEARHYHVHKYIAQAHALLARIAMAEDDLGSAQQDVNIALDELRQFPVPVIAWKIHALAGRLQSQLGNSEAARASYQDAAGVVNQIAANVREDALREIFMKSAAVREVFEGAH